MKESQASKNQWLAQALHQTNTADAAAAAAAERAGQ